MCTSISAGMLIALVTGQRCQSIHLIDLGSIHNNADHYSFVVRDLVKQSAPGRKQRDLILPFFKEDYRVCVYSVLTENINRTLPHWGGVTRFFLSFVKPLEAVLKDGISRWIKTVMIQSGINVTVFKPHSNRAASTGKANSCQVPVDVILQAASWKADCTLRSFSNKAKKIVSLSLARLFLVLALQLRPFLYVAMFSFHLYKLWLPILGKYLSGEIDTSSGNFYINLRV